MSVRPPAPGQYPRFPQYGRAIAHHGFPQPPYGRPYAPVPPQPRPTSDPGTLISIIALVMFIVLALPMFVIGMAFELNPTLILSATMSTMFLAIHAFGVSKRYGRTNAIAVVTMILCMMLAVSGLVSAVIRLLLIL